MTKQEVIELVTHLQEWHKNIVELLKLIKDADDSVSLELQNKEGDTVTIRGDMKVALNIIEGFPIEITEE